MPLSRLQELAVEWAISELHEAPDKWKLSSHGEYNLRHENGAEIWVANGFAHVSLKTPTFTISRDEGLGYNAMYLTARERTRWWHLLGFCTAPEPDWRERLWDAYVVWKARSSDATILAWVKSLDPA